MKEKKYPIDVMPQLVIPIRHKPKYVITDTVEVPVRISKKDIKSAERILGNRFEGKIIGAHYVLRTYFVSQIKTYITKHYPKAKMANIICHLITENKLDKKYVDYTISVDVLA